MPDRCKSKMYFSHRGAVRCSLKNRHEGAHKNEQQGATWGDPGPDGVGSGVAHTQGEKGIDITFLFDTDKMVTDFLDRKLKRKRG